MDIWYSIIWHHQLFGLWVWCFYFELSLSWILHNFSCFQFYCSYANMTTIEFCIPFLGTFYPAWFFNLSLSIMAHRFKSYNSMQLTFFICPNLKPYIRRVDPLSYCCELNFCSCYHELILLFLPMGLLYYFWCLQNTV